MTATLRAIRGDITALNVDAVVNSANTSLLGGPELLAACRALGGCPSGQARITPGFNLTARWIIHTVRPAWKGGPKGEAEPLASCYRESLQFASLHSIYTVAFPTISTGAHAYPLEAATEIVVSTVRECTVGPEGKIEVVFCCFSGEDHAIYKRVLGVARD